MRGERNSWGVPQFLLAVVLGAAVYLLRREIGDSSISVTGRRGFVVAGFVAAIVAAWFGHSSYPRVYNFKVYALNMGVAAVSFAAVLLLFLVPLVFDVSTAIYYPATILLSYLSLLFVFVVTVIVPEYLGYRVTVRLTLVLVGIIFAWYLLGLGVPVVRRVLAMQLLRLQDIQSTAFWGLSSAAAVVLLLSLFSEAHSMGIGGIHAGGVLLLSVGWLAPGSDTLLHTLVITSLPILIAFGTLIHWLRRLENRASYDPLLRVYNREWCDRVIAEQSRLDVRPPFTIALLDLDHFKAVNDTHGHDAGDAVLREAAQRIRNGVLPHGAVGRYGGEEILLFLPQYDEKSAEAVLESVRRSLEERPVSYKSATIPMTASIGFAVRTERDQPLQIILHAADRALYAAKEGGRNQIRRGRLRRRQER